MRAGRAEVVSWKDIPQDAASIVEWSRRRREVFGDTDPHRDWVRSLGHHGAPRLRELGKEYGADFVLTDRRRPVSLPVAYRNRTYVVYKLP